VIAIVPPHEWSERTQGLCSPVLVDQSPEQVDEPVDRIRLSVERGRVAEAGCVERDRGGTGVDEGGRRDVEEGAVAAEAERVPVDERDGVR
jgi:hypothetical protein